MMTLLSSKSRFADRSRSLWMVRRASYGDSVVETSNLEKVGESARMKYIQPEGETDSQARRTAVPEHDQKSIIVTRWLAIVAIWVAFGSAYVAIKVGVSGAPPLLFSGPRFLIAGSILLGVALIPSGGRLKMSRRDVVLAAVAGTALIAGGQGGVSYASQFLTPGITAVLVSTAPIWAAVFGRITLGTRIPAQVTVGLVIGFVGVIFLTAPWTDQVNSAAAVIAVLAAIFWAGGTLIGARQSSASRPIATTAIGCISGGIVQILAGTALGEWDHLHLTSMHSSIWVVFTYLVVVPSAIGMSLFCWLLATSSSIFANTQSYVSPIVALFLGWLLLGDPLTVRVIACAAVVLVGVALIVTRSAHMNGNEAAYGERSTDQHERKSGTMGVDTT